MTSTFFRPFFYSSLVFLIIVSLLVPSVGAFTDVGNDHENSTAIDYVYQQGIVEGYSDGTYSPESSVNRAELSKIMIEALYSGDEIADCDTSVYSLSDVTPDLWYAPSVCVSLRDDILAGYPDGTFVGENPVNFAEAAKIMANAFDDNEIMEDPNLWYRPYVDNLARVNAVPTSISSFEVSLTRGEVAEMIYRLHADVQDLESLDFDGVGANAESSTDSSSENASSTSSSTSSGETVSAEADEDCLGKDEPFLAYPNSVNVYCDETYMYVESQGLADHEMMVGITAWNQQVPLPQFFEGDNATRIPLYPVMADEPTDTTGQGANGVAANGVTYFNPTQQSGIYSLTTDPNLIGELDACGGHSGRGDDYHYHVSPQCLDEEILAYALDGYAIYGLYNSDGSTPVLDACGGEYDADGNYHYHAQEDYPYVNGCFSGEVDFSLQPQSHPVREVPDGGPSDVLITALYEDSVGVTHVEFDFEGSEQSVNYSLDESGCFVFEYVDYFNVGNVTETYCGNVDLVLESSFSLTGSTGTLETSVSTDDGDLTLFSSVMSEGGSLPTEYTCDGSSSTPPLEWSGAPERTEAFALLMDHMPGPDEYKWYWLLYDISASTSSLSVNTSEGTLGTNTVDGDLAYSPPCSSGAGEKEYSFHLYALSEDPALSGDVGRDELLDSISDITLDSADLNITYER
jgi:phosphatidylethanolamine-binding protein (PEBP) family uncharacterized protein